MYVLGNNSRIESRDIKVIGYAGNDMLFRSAGDIPVADGDQVVITQIREGGAGIRVDVRQ